MAVNTFQTLYTFTPSNSIQPTVQTASDVPIFTSTVSTQYVTQTVLLAAAGTSFTLPIPANWTVVDSVSVINTDLLGYCVLTLNSTTGAPVIQLAPMGGTFSATFGLSVPAATVAANPVVWTLKSCSSTGVLASGVATYVYIYMTGH